MELLPIPITPLLFHGTICSLSTKAQFVSGSSGNAALQTQVVPESGEVKNRVKSELNSLPRAAAQTPGSHQRRHLPDPVRAQASLQASS